MINNLPLAGNLSLRDKSHPLIADSLSAIVKLSPRETFRSLITHPSLLIPKQIPFDSVDCIPCGLQLSLDEGTIQKKIRQTPLLNLHREEPSGAGRSRYPCSKTNLKKNSATHHPLRTSIIHCRKHYPYSRPIFKKSQLTRNPFQLPFSTRRSRYPPSLNRNDLAIRLGAAHSKKEVAGRKNSSGSASTKKVCHCEERKRRSNLDRKDCFAALAMTHSHLWGVTTILANTFFRECTHLGRVGQSRH